MVMGSKEQSDFPIKGRVFPVWPETRMHLNYIEISGWKSNVERHRRIAVAHL